MTFTFNQPIQSYLDTLTHKLLHSNKGAVSVHAEDVLAGTFGAGNFVFPGQLDITDIFRAKKQYVSGGIAMNRFWDSLEIAHVSSTPYIDFHRSSNPEEATDYNVRLINDADGVLHMFGHRFTIGSVNIEGTSGRNYFKDSEKSSGTGLRVGAAWGYYGIYAEDGDVVVGSTTGIIRLNGGARSTAGGNSSVGEIVGGASLVGSAGLPATGNFIIQAFTQVVSFSGANGSLTFPQAFPNGVVSVVATNGDGGNDLDPIFATRNYSTTGCGINAVHGTGHSFVSGLERVNAIAVGW